MWEHTKKHITADSVEVRFIIPLDKLEEVRKALVSIGAEEASESISWEKVYPDFHPGVALRGAMKKEALTQRELARLLGVSRLSVFEMEQGKRPIDKEMAKRLGKVLKINYRVFL